MARGPWASIDALAATSDGVLVAGAESSKRAQSEPFVAAFEADGRERYRITLAEPRSTTTPPRARAVALAATPSGDAYVVSTATRVGGTGAVVLSLVDAHGRLRFSTSVELSILAEPSRALSLLVAELGPTGEPLQARLLGPPSARLSVSDVAVASAGLLVTGEYEGPPIELGKVALCELEGGMPEPEPRTFHELGGGPHCACRRDRRDLFLLALDASLEPRWATTLALGGPTPRVTAGARGEILWAAESSGSTATHGSTADPSRELWLWSLDAAGTVSARRGAPGGLSQMTAGPGHLSDQRVLRKIKW